MNRESDDSPRRRYHPPVHATTKAGVPSTGQGQVWVRHHSPAADPLRAPRMHDISPGRHLACSQTSNSPTISARCDVLPHHAKPTRPPNDAVETSIDPPPEPEHPRIYASFAALSPLPLTVLCSRITGNRRRLPSRLETPTPELLLFIRSNPLSSHIYR